MSDLDTKAIRERAERATKGPWAVHEKVSVSHDRRIRAFEGTDDAHTVSFARCLDDDEDDSVRDANATFIAHARTDVPALCDALDAARAELAQAKQEREMLRGTLGQILKAWDQCGHIPDYDIVRAALDGTKETA